MQRIIARLERLFTLFRNAYAGLSLSTWWLSLVMAINRMGTMVVPFMTLYLTQKLHYSIGKAGLVFSLFGLGAVCGGFLGGRICDKFGFFNVQLFTLFFGGIGFMILGFMKSYEAICITTFLLSIINESFRPANALAIAHYSSEENRTRSYALNRLAINVGWAFGGTLGGFIAGWNYHLLFWIDGFTNIGAVALLWFILRPAGRAAQTAQRKASDHVRRFQAFRDLRYMAFIFFTFLYAFSFFQLFSTQPVFYRTQYHLPEWVIGLTMALNGVLIALFEMMLIYKLEGKRKHTYFITRGSVLVALSFVIFNFVPHGTAKSILLIPLNIIIASVSMLIVTSGEMLSMPFMNSYWISCSNNENRGQYAGLYTVAWAAAQVLGPYCGSLIADHYGFRNLWWVITLVCLLSAIGYRWLQSWEKN